MNYEDQHKIGEFIVHITIYYDTLTSAMLTFCNFW